MTNGYKEIGIGLYCLPVENLLVSVPMYCMVTGYNYLSSLQSAEF